MACWDTDPYLCTYDSGGGKDYSSLTTWEEDTDVNLGGYGILVLDCYDSQDHSQNVDLAGASTNSTHYRKIQSSSSCSTPYTGIYTSGAHFDPTLGNENAFTITEAYSRIVDISVQVTSTHANASPNNTFHCTGMFSSVMGCLAYKPSNSSTGEINRGFYANSNYTLFHKNIALDCYDGYYIDTTGSAAYIGTTCCTSDGASNYGLYSNETGSSDSWVWSNLCDNSTTSDFRDTSGHYHTTRSGWNAAGDTSADLGGDAGDNYKNSYTPSIDANGLATASMDAAGGAGDNYGRNVYNDISAQFDWYDYFRNDTAGDMHSQRGIEGNDRYQYDTADSGWDVGASEAEAPTDLVITDGGAYHTQHASNKNGGANIGLNSTDLVVANCAHLQVADQVPHFQFTVTVNESYHLQVVDSPELDPISIQVANTYHAHAGPEIFSLTVTPTVQDSAHTQATDPIKLVEIFTLEMQSCVHTQDAANTPLHVHLIIVPDGYYPAAGSHVVSSDNIDLTEIHILDVDDSVHLQAADDAFVVPPLSVDEAAHVQSVESFVLNQGHTLSVQSCAHVQAAEAPRPVYISTLAVDSAVHIQASESPDMTVNFTLTVQGSVHAQVAGSAFAAAVLVVQDSAHIQAGDSTGRLYQTHYLDMEGSEDNIHIQAADNIEFVALPADLTFLTITKYAA